MQRPRQAVILAGGRGTRLAPLTDTIPKPMIRFHGKPFLEYLIELLRDQGFDRILLLLGYLPETIRDYFGDGRRWGVSIEYEISDVEWDTGQRIKSAHKLIDPVFFLMYCDNYWPMRFEPLWKKFVASRLQAQITAYRNTDNYTRNNLRVDSHDRVVDYDRSRQRPGLSGVEIGFAILLRSTIDLLPGGNVCFEGEVYPELVKKRQLGAYVTDHRYYSVGSLDRLPLTGEFLARRPAVFLDRDGVLNKKMSRGEYVCTWDQWEWLPGVKKALKLFEEVGCRVIVITNQPGIARGAMTLNALNEIHQKMKEEAAESGGRIYAVYTCLHGWDEGCECRKPKPGLLFQAQRDHSLDLSRIHFIGDDERDIQAAEAAGCLPALVSENKSLLDIAQELIHATSGKHVIKN